MRRWLTRGVLPFFAAVGTPLLLHSQSPQASDGKPLTFEVASVKLNTSPNGNRGITISPSGRATLTHISLRDLIWIANATDSIREPAQVVGGPSWLTTEYFDIVAKSDALVDAEGKGARDRLNLMLKSLITERFKGRTHVETRETQVYSLVLANKGSTLGPAIHASTHDCPKDTACGFRNLGGSVVAMGVTMENIAFAFANFSLVDGPTRNATGLTGRFDFELNYTPGSATTPDRPDQTPNAEFIGNLMRDVQEQLGLKFQREKAPADFVVIDHIERPTPD